MIIFMYTHVYCDDLQNKSGDESALERYGQQDVKPDVQLLSLSGFQTDTRPESVERMDEAKRAGVLNSLLFHVKMNAIADYYDVSELRVCANAKINNILDTSWSSHNFPIVLREVFSSTGDKELHNILSKVMVAHIDELIGQAENIAPPDLFSDFAMSVVRNMAAATKDMRDSFTRKTEDLEYQRGEVMDSLRRSILETRDAAYRLENLRTGVDNFNKLLRRTTSCRSTSCNNMFGCYMDEDQVEVDHPSYILRCSRCNCRHWYSG
jgi:hypothetical protein